MPAGIKFNLAYSIALLDHKLRKLSFLPHHFHFVCDIIHTFAAHQLWGPR